MIDTGSTVSLLNSKNVSNTIYEKTSGNIQINTIAGKVNRGTEYVKTHCPVEFQQPTNARMRWVKIFMDKPYHFLIGMDWIEKNVTSFDVEHREIILKNGTKIPFLSKTVQEEVNVIEESKLGSITLDHLNKEEQFEMLKLLGKYPKLFYREGDNLTNTTRIVHEIRTTTNEQIYSKLYRFPPQHEIEVRKQMEEMEKNGIIRKSNSRYCSPIIVIPKKKDNSGIQKYRIVVDYRKINEITIDDKYPLRNIESILDKLGKAQYFSTIDLAKGYHQILMAEKDIEKTAYITLVGYMNSLECLSG